MKKKIKSLSLIFIVVLITSLLMSACNKTEREKNTADTTIKKTPSSASSSKKTVSTGKTTNSTSAVAGTGNHSDEQQEYEPGENDEGTTISEDNRPEYTYDFGGATIILGHIVGTVLDEPVQYPWNNDRAGAHVYGDDPVLDKQFDWTRDIERKFNCQVKIISYASDLFSSHTRFTTEVLAGIHTSDIFMTNPLYCTPTFMSQGLIYPISDYIDFDADPILSDPFVKNTVTYRGKQWGIFSAAPLTVQSIVYNLDIRDRDGLQDPMELDMNGQWTWDACIDVLKDATHDYDGDGVIDQWGMSLASGTVYGTFCRCKQRYYC